MVSSRLEPELQTKLSTSKPKSNNSPVTKTIKVRLSTSLVPRVMSCEFRFDVFVVGLGFFGTATIYNLPPVQIRESLQLHRYFNCIKDYEFAAQSTCMSSAAKLIAMVKLCDPRVS